MNWQDISREKILQIVEDRLLQYYYLPSEFYEQDRLVIHLTSIINRNE